MQEQARQNCPSTRTNPLQHSMSISGRDRAGSRTVAYLHVGILSFHLYHWAHLLVCSCEPRYQNQSSMGSLRHISNSTACVSWLFHCELFVGFDTPRFRDYQDKTRRADSTEIAQCNGGTMIGEGGTSVPVTGEASVQLACCSSILRTTPGLQEWKVMCIMTTTRAGHDRSAGLRHVSVSLLLSGSCYLETIRRVSLYRIGQILVACRLSLPGKLSVHPPPQSRNVLVTTSTGAMVYYI
ncbi:hypothetical protein GGS26DRAFT_514031 [Hypomontagnella submonticulosa]|nr:hypothetical protein GGS26DRAFT_514031 [Hypomontagnella submonticulosa]